MDKNKILEMANKEKLATGVCGEFSKKLGIKPMYLRGGLVAASLIVNPLVGIGVYGAGLAYKHFKK